MAHSWQFFSAGGVDQVAIRTGADLANLGSLDQKLWVALACPTRGIEFDTRTLDLIDTDKDGRIRPPELIAACEWACAHLRHPDLLIRGGDGLSLAELSKVQGGTDSDSANATDVSASSGADAEASTSPSSAPASDGPDLAAEARRILELLGKPAENDEAVLTIDDVSDRARLIAAMRFNGDGVISPKTAEDDDTQALIQHIMDTQGSVKDLSGELGVDRARVDQFFTHAAALHDWHAKVVGDATIQPYGEGTAAAASALEAVRAKIDDFFARCRLAAFDAAATGELNPSVERYRDISAQTLSLKSSAISDLPLAPIVPDRTLPLLGSSVNPAWSKALADFQKNTVQPRLGQTADATSESDQAAAPSPPQIDELTESQWADLQACLAPYLQWLATRPVTSLDTMSIDDIERIVAGNGHDIVNGLMDDDKAMEPHNALIADLERLLRYKRDLLRLVHNFVSFKDFYRREGAIFEAGVLYLDARSCDLTIEVADMAKHATLAGMAKACLAYCHLQRDGQKKTIVAAFTAGDTDFLFVGRNGIFYDRQGKDWDATIVKMIDNPTNVRQAFMSPYKKFIRAIEEQVAKRAAASDTAVQNDLGALAGGLAAAGTPGATAPAAAKATNRIDVGTVAALGVALGSISAVMVGIFAKFVDLGWWIPVALLGIMLAISGPSMLVAWLKLRERSLGPILDASGWAINGRMHVNVRLGRLLSQTAHVPLHAKTMKDPYAETNRAGWITLLLAIAVVVLLALCWRFSLADGWLPANARYPALHARVSAAIAAAKVP